MGSMKRLILPWAAFAVVLCFALPASAANGRSVKGVITALSGDAVSHSPQRMHSMMWGERITPCRGYGASGSRFSRSPARHHSPGSPSSASARATASVTASATSASGSGVSSISTPEA